MSTTDYLQKLNSIAAEDNYFTTIEFENYNGEFHLILKNDLITFHRTFCKESMKFLIMQNNPEDFYQTIKSVMSDDTGRN